MAKRVRGSSTRPGQRARMQRRAAAAPRPTSEPARSPSTSLTAAEEARAAELEAEILASERAAETKIDRARERARRPVETEVRVRSGSIAERASHEYAYVLRDVRRIALIGGSLTLLLFALWIAIQASGAGQL